VITRLSIQYGILSILGTTKNNPGPLRDLNFPSRNITALSHGSAIFIADDIITAVIKKLPAMMAVS
jgi:hypothetical protein